MNIQSFERSCKQNIGVKPLLLALLCGVLLAGSAAAGEQSGSPVVVEKSSSGNAVYGGAMPLDPPAQAVAAVSTQFAELAGTDIKLSGRISKVCQKKGCWMMLSDGDQALRVIFGKHDFFIPMDTAGNAIAYGRLEKIEMPLEEAKHMAKDAGQDPKTVTKPEVEYRLTATSVEIVQG